MISAHGDCICCLFFGFSNGHFGPLMKVVMVAAKNSSQTRRDEGKLGQIDTDNTMEKEFTY